MHILWPQRGPSEFWVRVFRSKFSVKKRISEKKKAVQGQNFCQDSSTGSVKGRRIRKGGRVFSEEFNKCMSES